MLIKYFRFSGLAILVGVVRHRVSQNSCYFLGGMALAKDYLLITLERISVNS